MLKLNPNQTAFIVLSGRFGEICNAIGAWDEIHQRPVFILADKGGRWDRYENSDELGESSTVDLSMYQIATNNKVWTLSEATDAITLGHFHHDHLAGLKSFNLIEAAELKSQPLFVFGTPETMAVAEYLVGDKFAETFSFRNPEDPEDNFWLPSLSGKKPVIEFSPFDAIEFFGAQHQTAVGSSHIFFRRKLGDIYHTVCYAVDFNWQTEKWLDSFVATLTEQQTSGVVLDDTGIFYQDGEPTDKEIDDNLEEILREAPGAVIVAGFASNILDNWQRVVDAAQKTRRKYIVLVGRTLREMLLSIEEVAQHISFGDLELINSKDLYLYDDREVVIFSTGGQAEPDSGLVRYIFGEERNQVGVHHNVTILLASHVIPDPEIINSVKAMVMELIFSYMVGLFNGELNLISGDQNFVDLLRHISDNEIAEFLRHKYGYVNQEDVVEFCAKLSRVCEYQLISRHGHANRVKLQAFISKMYVEFRAAKLPLPYLILTHGTIEHQKATTELAREIGWPEERIFCPRPEGGDAVIFENGEAKMIRALGDDRVKKAKGTSPEEPIRVIRGDVVVILPNHINLNDSSRVFDGTPIVQPNYFGIPGLSSASFIDEQVQELFLSVLKDYGFVLIQEQINALFPELIKECVAMLQVIMPIVETDGVFYRYIPHVDIVLSTHE